MRKFLTVVSVASLAVLSACGGKGDDALGERAEEVADNKADAMDAAADNMSGPAKENMEDKADAVREAGDAREDAIDDADVNAQAMTPAEKDAAVNK